METGDLCQGSLAEPSKSWAGSLRRPPPKPELHCVGSEGTRTTDLRPDRHLRSASVGGDLRRH